MGPACIPDTVQNNSCAAHRLQLNLHYTMVETVASSAHLSSHSPVKMGLRSHTDTEVASLSLKIKQDSYYRGTLGGSFGIFSVVLLSHNQNQFETHKETVNICGLSLVYLVTMCFSRTRNALWQIPLLRARSCLKHTTASLEDFRNKLHNKQQCPIKQTRDHLTINGKWGDIRVATSGCKTGET